MESSAIKLSLTPSQVRPFKMQKNCSAKTLSTFGVAIEKTAMDDLSSLQTTASTMTPVQYLQYILPDIVETVTSQRAIDEILGRDTVGEWEGEQVVTEMVEYTGNARPYGDTTTTPLANINVNFDARTIIRLEQGIEVNLLEEARSAKIRIDLAQRKRNAAAKSLAIEMNRIGFFGYNNGTNRTYGFLNDPNLPAYITVAATGTGGNTTWATKSFANITADIRTAVAALRTKSGNLINSSNAELTLVVPASSYEYLSTTTDLGMSVMEWINKTYPNMRVLSAIELDGANGGSNVFYLFADELDGQRVFRQHIVQAFRLLGVARREKGYTEAYSCATAGVSLNIPAGLVRYTGI